MKILSRVHARALLSTLTVLALLVASLPAGPAQAARLEVSDDAFVDVHLLLHTLAQIERNPVEERKLIGPTFRVHRARMVLRGQVAPKVGFYFGTGYDGSTGSAQVWDAVSWVTLDRALVLDAGLVMVPFMRHGQQFGSHLHGVEFMRTAFLYPRGSTNLRRSPGVRARGLIIKDRIDYRIAATNGAPTESGLPRLTGRVGLNLLEPEPGYILPGTYFGKERVLAVGAAFDFQPDVVEDDKSYYAAGADLFWSIPNGTHRITGQVGVVYYRGLNAFDQENRPFVADRTGVGVILDAGYAFGTIEPVASVEWFRPESAEDFDDERMAAHLGINWLIQGPVVNLKLDGGLIKEPGHSLEDATRVVTLQLQTLLP